MLGLFHKTGVMKPGGFTTSTEQSRPLAKVSAVLSTIRAVIPERPAEPMTIRYASRLTASRRISSRRHLRANP
jgi:hypothetical protein